MPRRATLAGLACAGVAVGILAERQAYGWSDLRDWLPDLLAGWSLIGLGIALLAMRRPRGAAVLLLLAGFSWFAFNFENTGPPVVQWLAVHAAYVHRGPLFQLALAPPDGRPRSSAVGPAVALAWTAALVWPLWDDDATALVLVATFVGFAAVERRRVVGGRDRALAVRGLAAAALLGAAIGADAIRNIAGAPQGVADATVLFYAAATVLAGIVLFTASFVDAPSSLAERAAALEHRGETLRDALRDLLGDPGLEIGFAVNSGELVDDDGHALGPPATGAVTTPVIVADTRVAVVVHEPATLENEAIRSSVMSAVGLVAERTRLRAEVGRQVAAVEASRRRLLLAEDEERRRLADRLDRGPGEELAEVERLVGGVRPAVVEHVPLAAAIDRAAEQLARVRPELDALVRGLGGVGADGLVPALERLVADVPIPIELDVADVDLPVEVASVLWFVCSESLANAVKHADAHGVRVSLAETPGMVRLSVRDDGRGGADPRGSGLAGLADRVGALGGRLEVDSPQGGGTLVVAELPRGAAAAGERASTGGASA